MNREKFDHLIRVAGRILERDRVVVVGSQAILGAVDRPDDLAEPLVRSIEVDLLPLPDPDERLADLIDALIGELSPFHQTHGVYAQGVGERTAILPDGWQDRLVPYITPGTGGTTALCLEPHDLCIAKLAAGRDKDYEYVKALAAAGLVALRVVRTRLASTPGVDRPTRQRIEGWLRSKEA
jgi:uncharacterized nucleotidyltransferase DUF6036